MILCTKIPSKTVVIVPFVLHRHCRHVDEICVTGCTGNRQNDNLRCSQRREICTVYYIPVVSFTDTVYLKLRHKQLQFIDYVECNCSSMPKLQQWLAKPLLNLVCEWVFWRTIGVPSSRFHAEYLVHFTFSRHKMADFTIYYHIFPGRCRVKEITKNNLSTSRFHDSKWHFHKFTCKKRRILRSRQGLQITISHQISDDFKFSDTKNH